jgi:hypothetical protein
MKPHGILSGIRWCEVKNMARERFSYVRCIGKLDEIVRHDVTRLPSLDGKNDAMTKMNEYIQDHVPPVLYRYMPASDNAISSILDEDIYMVPATKMNDAFEGAAYGINSSVASNQQEIRRIQNEICLKSFSYAKNSNLMWSHYGDAHKGICIGYDCRKVDKNIISHLYPVQYSNTRFSNVDMQKVASHAFLFLRKSTDWKYEKEFRLIYKNSELRNENKIALNCISEITFGLRADPQQIELVKSLIQRSDIVLYRTKQKRDSFELTREKI